MRQVILTLIFSLLPLLTTVGQTGTYIPSESFSSSLISDLCQDNDGFIWIGTDYGINKFDGYRFKQMFHDDNDNTSINNSCVRSIFCDKQGQLWVGTNRGLDRYDRCSSTYIHYNFPNGIRPHISCITQLHDGTLAVGTAGYGAFIVGDDMKLYRSDNFDTTKKREYYSGIYEDSHGRIWTHGYDKFLTMTENGKSRHFESSVGISVTFTELNGQFLFIGVHGLMTYKNGQLIDAGFDTSVLERDGAVIMSAAVNHEGTLFLGTRGNGLYYVQKGSRRIERFEVNTYGIDMSTAKVKTILCDARNNLWIGCERKGLVLVSDRPLQFRNLSFSNQNIKVSSPITMICEGDNGIKWCTVQGVGIYGFDDTGHVVAHPKAPSTIESITRDMQGRYWVGTMNTLYQYNPLTGESKKEFSYEGDRMNDLTIGSDGKIYVSAFSRGLCIYDPKTKSLKNHNMYERQDKKKGRLCNNWILSMSPDKKGRIWLGTASGVTCYDPSSDSFKPFGWESLMPDTMCFSLCELHDGSILVGTDHGLYRYNNAGKRMEHFPGSEVLNDKIISYIVQSNDNDIWCATSMGIWQYDRQNKRFIGYVNGNGLTTKEYLYGVGMHTDDDHIYFGTNHGLTAFSPKQIEDNRPSPDTVHLVALLLGGQTINSRTMSDGSPIFEGCLFDTDYFALSYLDNSFTLVFSQMNFENPANINYEYRVNNSEWKKTLKGENGITLSHINPGTYIIEVRAITEGAVSPIKKLKVYVRAPWWHSPLAYSIYAFLLLMIILYIFYIYRQRTREQMNEDKMKFLINATHDIRSPLTLIMSPLAKIKAQLLESGSPFGNDEDLRNSFSIIERNSQRILNLVNQILDVRKIDKQQMQLHCRKVNLVELIGSICKMFEFSAKERNIVFTFEHESDVVEAWIDNNQFDKVISNLLSNAFKYTPDGGNISVLLVRNEEKISMSVADSGMGIDDETSKHIFERFYQGDNTRRMGIAGTGIGLNLCKMIVDLHHGTITASNRTDMSGSIFTVEIPTGNSHLKADEIEKEAELPKHTPAETSSSGKRILVVDDDEEIRNYICLELGKYYKFGTATNGKEALSELLAGNYDLVVSDVMMPEMDGFTMLRMIKTNMNISHIPVIMLTSKADVGNRLEGLERGADAFMAKPFDMKELHLTIDNLINNRQRLKGKFSGAQQQADKIEQKEVKGNDEILMERIMKAVNKNLSDSDFNVDMLTQEVGISRAQLHRKMKEMTGISTSEFIRNIRLEQAARLLKEQKINVTQVAYATGFSNLAHFSTVFRKHFGVSPSEFVERETYSAQKE